MAIPFTVVTGAIFISDTNGNIVDTVTSDGVRLKTQTKIVGDDGLLQADVAIADGRKRLATLVSLDPGGKVIPTLGTNLFYDDMNVANGGVARDTNISNVWTKVYEESGGNGGVLLGFLVTLENIDELDPNKSWVLRLVVDGVEIFSNNGILLSDLQDDDIYNFDSDPAKGVPKGFGFLIRNRTLRFESPSDLPISYNSSIQIYLKKMSSDKKIRAGLVCITKE